MVWIALIFLFLALIFLFIVMVALVSGIRDLSAGFDYLKDKIDGYYGVGGLKREMDWLENMMYTILRNLKRIEESGMTEEELKERRREEKKERGTI